MFHTSFQPSACAYAVPQFRLVDTCAGQDSMLPLPCRLQGELLLYSRTKHRHRPFPEIYPALLRPGLDVNQNFTEGSGKQKKLEQRNLQPVIKYGGFWSCPLQPTIWGVLLSDSLAVGFSIQQAANLLPCWGWQILLSPPRQPGHFGSKLQRVMPQEKRSSLLIFSLKSAFLVVTPSPQVRLFPGWLWVEESTAISDTSFSLHSWGFAF